MLKEFKEFAIKGNAVDLAVGVIIGAAFGGVVTAIVNDIFNPVIGLIMSASNAADLANRYVLLKAGKGGVTHFDTIAAAKGAGAVVLAYGDLINTAINFVIVASVLFLVVRAMNKLKSPAPTASEPVAKDCPYCTMSIPIKATKCPQCTSALTA